MTVVPIDPVALEIVRHGFIAAADEMKLSLMRTAHNPIIYEVLDFSVGVFDRQGRMVAQADGLPIFLGSLGFAVRAVVADIGEQTLEAGDLYLFNDPYEQGNHVNDVTTVEPVFHAGELCGFVSTRAHWLDIGGKDPGGSLDCTDVVQEGLWLRSIPLYRRGVLDEAVWRIIEYNVRYTEKMLGDLRAQVAASRTGAARFGEILCRHGVATVEAAVSAMLAQGEQRARAAVASLPDGSYSAETWIDTDCVGSGPLPVRVSVTIRRSDVIIDLTETGEQAHGPVNCGLPAAVASCRIALKAFTSPDAPATEGDFAPLIVIAPLGSRFNATYPAPTFLYAKGLTDAVVRALTLACPGRGVAGPYDDLAGFMLVGAEPATGSLYIQQEPEIGGWGASADQDGESALIFTGDGDTRNIPAEVIEARFPLRLERHALRPDSGGAGRRRGGLGIIRDYRILDHSPTMLAIMDRTHCRPWGMFGGRDAEPDVVVVQDGAASKSYAQAMGEQIASGALVSVRTGGGGGWGDAREREPELVWRDVVSGYVSEEAARESYGVVLDPVTREVDPVLTTQLRGETRR
ncbi:MAG: hydantoinase B/oxoprolinase family protein [Gaiellales bacterium]